MTKIFLISARTGSWDEEQEWNICFFLTRVDAEKYRILAQIRADEIRMNYWQDDLQPSQYDPTFTMDPTTGTKYYIEEITLGKV
jgi:hypothetical protein